jgi:hypothetical protein
MKTQNGNGKRKWVIIPVKVLAGKITPIDFKIPANVVSCDGVILSVLQPISSGDFRRIGELSMTINTRQVHPMQMVLDYYSKATSHKTQPLPLDEPLHEGSIIGGFYRDFSGKNYTLNIYLACRLNSSLQ